MTGYARSQGPTGLLAQRRGVSTETIRKWRKRGAEDCLDRSAKPHRLPWKAAGEERAIVCAVRRAANFPLGGLAFAVGHFLPHLNRHSIWRILKAEGLNRRAKPVAERPAKARAPSRATTSASSASTPGACLRSHSTRCAAGALGCPAQAASRRWRAPQAHSPVAIGRCPRSAHLAAKGDEAGESAIAFLREAAAAFPFQLTHMLAGNGSCFTPAFAKACADLGARHRRAKPRAPQANGMAERSNGRIGGEALSINIHSHQALEQPLRGFNQAGNARPGQSQAPGTRRSPRHNQSTPHRRSRQRGLAT